MVHSMTASGPWNSRTNEVMAIFQGLNNSGRTIVLVTHDAEIANHCQRIARIERGRIVADERVIEPKIALQEAL